MEIPPEDIRGRGGPAPGRRVSAAACGAGTTLWTLLDCGPPG